MGKSGKMTPQQLDELIKALANEKPDGKYGENWYGAQLADSEAGQELLALDRDTHVEAVRLLLEKIAAIDAHLNQITREAEAADDYNQVQRLTDWQKHYSLRHPVELSLRGILRRKLPLPETTIVGLLRWLKDSPYANSMWMPLAGIAAAVENFAAASPLSEKATSAIRAAAQRLATLPHHERDDDTRKTAARLAKLVPWEKPVQLDPGEAWSNAALADLEAMEPDRRSAWESLLAACQEGGTGSKPTAKWLKTVKPLMQAVGREDFREKLRRWLPLVDRPRTQPMTHPTRWAPDYDQTIEPHHVDLLKGLAWCAGMEADRDLARTLAALALSAYRKIPGVGPRLISLGHAAVAGLGMMPGMDAVGQLAILKLKIKFIPAQKMAEKALNSAAEREGLPREEIDELAVPSYGMEEVGRRVETFGDYTAEIVVDGSDAHLRWSKAGKPMKSVPAAAKKEHAEEVKELQAAVKDVGKMLTAQRDRIDGLFLARKSWPFPAWRERYLDHPLVGTIARRLIWVFETEGKPPVAGVWLKDRLLGVDDAAIEGLGESTKVSLWHPIDRTVEEVTAWRDWFDRHQIRQPFKQAYREVYVLTDAERNTGTYSNRFAAHILRQHQYHALCAARGWRNRLRLMVDDTYPPSSRDLPEWGLRAEFWVEGIGDNYGQDTTESGSYLHLSTDQVRFYQIAAPQVEAHAGGGGYSGRWNQADAEPVPIDRVPALVLSEIFRDVDLFVGVASVGNDQNWADGGPEGRYVDYWQGYSFGDLSANGDTRKAVLERLIPRLKIGPRCSFTARFLVVRGDIRTYKIHLGSGNILMEPNDQYLCIVPKRGTAESRSDGVFLPFEGDNVLSIILSKALMLAEDKKITDSTITSQLGRR